MSYLIIFFLKILENMISTLRIIIVSNGKKILGSILLFLVSIIWVISSSIAIINIDLIMILIFAIGSLCGSYLGSLIEEKIALGNNLIICITSFDISSVLKNNGYILTKFKGEGNYSKRDVLFIIIKRKENKELIRLIKNLDNNALIISEYTSVL